MRAELSSSEEEYSYHDADPSFFERGLRVFGLLTSLAAVGALVYWSFNMGKRDASQIPVIRAMEGEIRTAPSEPGGQSVDHQGLEVNEVAEGSTTAPAANVTLAPAPGNLENVEPAQTSPENGAENTPANGSANAQANEQANENAINQENTANSPGAEAQSDAANGTSLVAIDPPNASASGNAQNDAQTANSQQQGNQPALQNAPIAPNVPIVTNKKGRVAKPALRPNPLSLRIPPKDQLNPSTPEAQAGGQRVDNPGVPSATQIVDGAGAQLPNVATPNKEANAGVQTNAASPDDLGPRLPRGTPLIQIAAYEKLSSTKSEWEKVKSANADILGDKALYIEMTQVGGKNFYRLRVSGFASAAETRAACANLLARNVQCLSVSVK